MHDLSKEILEKYQVRKTRKQKTEFIELLQKNITNHPFVIEESGLFKSRNIIVGDLEKAKYIFTAHYDTQPVLPFPNFITPTNFFVFILYNTLIIIPPLLLEILFCFILLVLFDIDFMIFQFVNIVYWFFIIYMMIFGKANKHTANDNTSGVITLVEILKSTERNDICCVFFDHEEIGLVGSAQFLKMHKELMKNKIVINYDCVSDGDHFLFIYKNIDDRLKEIIENYPTKKYIQCLLHKKAIFPSDHTKFPNNIGVGAFHKNKIVGYYLGRLHTAKDTVFDVENIEMLRELSLQIVEE